MEYEFVVTGERVNDYPLALTKAFIMEYER